MKFSRLDPMGARSATIHAEGRWLLKETPGSQLFSVFGRPRRELQGPAKDGTYTITMQGVDVYDPVTNTIDANRADKDFGFMEPMKSDGIGKTPRDDRVQAGETRLVNVGRGDQRRPCPFHQPLHSHELTSFAMRRDATRSACWSVWGSTSPRVGR
jgi:hypothetical protein